MARKLKQVKTAVKEVAKPTPTKKKGAKSRAELIRETKTALKNYTEELEDAGLDIDAITGLKTYISMTDKIAKMEKAEAASQGKGDATTFQDVVRRMKEIKVHNPQIDAETLKSVCIVALDEFISKIVG